MKKSFKNNPALQFISQPEEKEIPISEPKHGYKLNPLYVETKTRRLQLIVKPSVYNKIKEKATEKNVSVNEYIHQLLEKDVE